MIGVGSNGVGSNAGPLAALPTAYPAVRVDRCWAHKVCNVLNKVRIGDRPAVKADLHGHHEPHTFRGRVLHLLALRIPGSAQKPCTSPTPSGGAFASSDAALS
jgi:transposase-like protein